VATAWDRKEAERLAYERIEAQDAAVNHPQNQRAMEQLKALVNVPGALKIITGEPRHNAPAGLLPKHPHYWVAHDVVRIDGPDHNGNLTAHSREGDRCKGVAHALLGRLTQYDRAADFTEERVEMGARRRAARQAAGHTEVRPERPLSKD
jgi:hypothetical protein